MARYIDADRLIKGIRDAVERIKPNECAKGIVEDTITLLQNEPTADVVEVKHGEWKQGVPYVCSICGKPAPDEKNTSERYSCWTSPYCPHCGAKMDGGKAE